MCSPDATISGWLDVYHTLAYMSSRFGLQVPYVIAANSSLDSQDVFHLPSFMASISISLSIQRICKRVLCSR
jgi:hypothetical protein